MSTTTPCTIDLTIPGAVDIRADQLEESGLSRELAGLELLNLLVGGQDHYTALHSQLDSANGRRRQRTVSHSQLDSAILAAHRDCWGSCAGDVVANCYGYRAERVCTLAIRRADGSVWVGIGVGNATKGSSPFSPTGCPVRRTGNISEALQAWANAQPR